MITLHEKWRKSMSAVFETTSLLHLRQTRDVRDDLRSAINFLKRTSRRTRERSDLNLRLDRRSWHNNEEVKLDYKVQEIWPKKKKKNLTLLGKTFNVEIVEVEASSAVALRQNWSIVLIKSKRAHLVAKCWHLNAACWSLHSQITTDM